MGGSRAERTRRLIDELIDRAHSDWPAVTFVLRLPSGEEVLIPRHTSSSPRCDSGHAGYYRRFIRPYCTGDPIPHSRGTCRVVPVNADQDAVPAYRVELGSGALTVGPGA